MAAASDDTSWRSNNDRDPPDSGTEAVEDRLLTSGVDLPLLAIVLLTSLVAAAMAPRPIFLTGMTTAAVLAGLLWVPNLTCRDQRCGALASALLLLLSAGTATLVSGPTGLFCILPLAMTLPFIPPQRLPWWAIVPPVLVAIGLAAGRDGWTSDLILPAVLLLGSVVGGRALAERLRHRLASQVQQTDEAQRANELKTLYLANMSHEIRTPMNGILAGSELLLGDELTPGQRAQAEVINQSARSLLTVIDDIIDFTRMERGRLVLNAVPFDLRRLVGEVHRLLQPQAAAKGLRFTIAYPPSFHQYFIGDPNRIRQVLLNLLGNAIKFTDAGSVQTTVYVCRPAPDRYQIELVVSDTGIGIRPDKQDHLFQEYSQADPAIARRYGGTGLGLSISRRITELMGGTIQLESQEQEGTSLTVLLPLPSCTEADVQPTEERLARRDYDRDVLVVEDDAVNQRVLQGLLERLGIRAVVVGNGQDAVDRVANERFDLVLMDLQMPVLDGLGATRAIRAAGNQVPIIAVTANALAEDRAAASDAGMDGFLGKPIRIEDLIAELDRQLAGDGATNDQHLTLPADAPS